MPLLSDLLHLDCRPALPTDAPQVIDIIQRIWEEKDYIPFA